MTLNPYRSPGRCHDLNLLRSDWRFDRHVIGALSLLHAAWHATVAWSLGAAVVERNAFVHLVGLTAIVVGFAMYALFRQSSKWIVAFLGWSILASYPPLCVFIHSLNNEWRPYEAFAFILLIVQAILLIVVCTDHVSPHLRKQWARTIFDLPNASDSCLTSNMAEPSDARESPT